jgi:phosphoribosylformylglycinamidine cyclo-ligase
MPDMYAEGEYDLAGFTVGAVEREDLIDGSAIAAGDAIIGIASSGPHSNGYSLIRKVLDRSPGSEIHGRSASERLLVPTRIYVKPILALLQSVSVKGLAHITGGGITENIPRVLQNSVDAEIDTRSWSPGPVFDWLAEHGNIASSEMRRTFNCGVGMVVIVDSADAEKTVQILSEQGESAWQIGQTVPGDPDAARTVHYL